VKVIYKISYVVQDVLKRLRLIDDRVVNALNTSLPTESFKQKKNSEEQCKQFCDQVCLTSCEFSVALLYVIFIYIILLLVYEFLLVFCIDYLHYWR